MTIRWLALAGTALACATFVACGGSSKKSDATPTARSGTPADTTPGSSGGAANPEIRAVAAKFAASTFNATYKATGADANAITGGQLAIIKSGDSNFRFDVTTQQDGQDVSIIFIQTPDRSAFCLKDAGELGGLLGIEPGQGVCFKTSDSDPTNPVGNIKELFAGVEDVNATLLEKSTRTIAGRAGTCYRTKDNDTGDVSTSCFADDGVLLYVKNEGDAPSEIEAQTVSGEVKDADFALPYEERELPAGFGG